MKEFIAVATIIFFLFFYSEFQKENSGIPNLPKLEKEDHFTLVAPQRPTPPLVKAETTIPTKTIFQQLANQFSNCQNLLLGVIHACDYKAVRNKSIVQIHKNHTGEFNLGMACDLYDYAIRDWKYVPDPTYFDHPFKASESLVVKRGDCDDFATMLAAILWSVGGKIRIVYATDKEGVGHAYTQINIGSKQKELHFEYLKLRYQIPESTLHYDRDAFDNIWLTLDYSKSGPGHTFFQPTIAYYLYPQQGAYE